MTLEQYIQNINSAYKRGIVLDGIDCVEIDQLKKSIVVDVTVGKDETAERVFNLSLEIVNQIEQRFGLTFVPEIENGNLCFINNNKELRDEFKQTFTPIDILDYIYAVLHSSNIQREIQGILEFGFSANSVSERHGKLLEIGGIRKSNTRNSFAGKPESKLDRN